ncbi:hypothetical protein [Streptomyces sp. NPDC093089]|uniref:hypothetical protein n=1 Tax=Streptomyces sp. NPDC093089 TaxID=3366024 RepID=UPI003823D4B6
MSRVSTGPSTSPPAAQALLRRLHDHGVRTVPKPAGQIVEDIVTAVWAGDDARIRLLLERLAPVADTETLLWLRRRLNDDLGSSAPAADERP